MKRPQRHCLIARALLLATIPVLVLPGCSNILTSEQAARQYYLLRPLPASGVPAADGETPDLVLRIAVIPGLDTDRILALDPDARLAHYANARWPDHLPEVLSSVVRRSLESTGSFGRVEAARNAMGDEWAVDLELRAFYGIRNGAGSTDSVRVDLAGTVACGSQSRLLDLADSASVAEERLAAVVAAHQAALDSVTRQLIARLDEYCGPVVSLEP